MAINTITASGKPGYNSSGNELANENKVFYDKTLIKRMIPNMVFYKFGQKRPLPKNSGDTINFRKFNSLTPAKTPLTEGVTPTGSELNVTKVEATVSQYGDYVQVSDKLDMLGIDPVITETSDLLGEQGADTIDQVTADVVVSGTSVRYAGGGANRFAITTSHKLTGDEIKKAVRDLKKANAKPLSDGYYVGIISPEQAFDLQADTLWQDISKYNGGVNIMKGEIGKIHGVRFIETTNLPSFESDVSFTAKTLKSGDSLVGLYAKDDSKTKMEERWVKQTSGTYASGTYYEKNEYKVFASMIIGADAYGVVDVENSAEGKPSIIVKPKGSAGTADPLDQRATIGWKAMFVAVRLNELAMCRLETTATV